MSAATATSHVLVFDDDQATLDLYRDLLTDVGYLVTLRDRLPDDPAVAARFNPSLILLDLIFAGADAVPPEAASWNSSRGFSIAPSETTSRLRNMPSVQSAKTRIFRFQVGTAMPW